MSAVAEHVAVEPEKRDVEWLKGALQTAVALEHSTLPLYLSAMFSLKIQNYTTYNLIRSVAMEEMGHMAIAANILSAIGGRPEIAGLHHGFPSHGLPGGAEPDVVARLAKLSKRQLQNFMRVEVPSFLLAPEYAGEEYPTIARLYQSIKDAIAQNEDELRTLVRQGGTSNQVGDDIGFTTISPTGGADPVSQLTSGIDEILEQGEGSSSETLHADPSSEGEESHYCKFAEIYYGHRYTEPSPPVELTRQTESRFFTGYSIPFPEVMNVLAVPADGYAKLLEADPNGGEVGAALTAFDTAYAAILANLDAGWNGPAAASWPTLGKAVMGMGSLRVLACFNINKFQVPEREIARLRELYPDEHDELAEYTDLDRPVSYGPRFANVSPPTP
jgi:hypothetical protein